jgi:hypothetical protein
VAVQQTRYNHVCHVASTQIAAPLGIIASVHRAQPLVLRSTRDPVKAQPLYMCWELCQRAGFTLFTHPSTPQGALVSIGQATRLLTK